MANAVIDDGNTVRYRTNLGPQTPSAPPNEDVSSSFSEIHDPRSDDNLDRPAPEETLDSTCDPTPGFIGFFFVLGLVLMWGYFAYLEKTNYAVLVATEWTFSSDVHSLQPHVEHDWHLPPDAKLISEEYKLHGFDTIVDRIEEYCGREMQSRQVYSHTESKCGDEFSHYTQDEEVYSHTEEVCYDDGTCEQDDVYDKVPGKAVYNWRCHDKPVYKDIFESKIVCKPVTISHEEPRLKLYYKYEVMRYKFARSVSTNSKQTSDPKQLLQKDEIFYNAQITFYLFFQDIPFPKQVTESVYEEYKNKIGEKVWVP